MACIRKRRGKWVIDYRDTMGKRRWVTVEGNREAAEAELTKIISNGKQPLITKRTFKECAEDWLKTYAKPNLKESTYQEYEAVLRNHVYPVFGQRPFSKVSREVIKTLIADSIANGCSRSTVRNIIAPIRGMYNHAIDNGSIHFNPASRLGRFNKRRGEDKRIDPLSREELSKFLKTTREKAPHWYAPFLCAPRSGIREGELISLKPIDVDFAGRFITVRRNFSRGKITSPKNGKTRRVDMSLQLTNTLDELIAQKKADALRREMAKPAEQRRKRDEVVAEVMESWLFTTPVGTQLDPSNLRKVFWDTLENPKLQPVPFHYLLHTFPS